MSRDAGIVVSGESVPWFQVADGIEMKVLHLGDDLPTWTVLIRFQAGERLPHHIHLAPAELYIIEGSGTHRATGDFSTGDHVFEHTGARHQPTTFHEETVLLMVSYGPVAVLNETGELDWIMDVDFFKQQLGPQATAAVTASA